MAHYCLYTEKLHWFDEKKLLKNERLITSILIKKTSDEKNLHLFNDNFEKKIIYKT